MYSDGEPAPEADLLAALASVDPDASVPAGDVFTGEMSGIRFYTPYAYDARKPCTYGPYGLWDGDGIIRPRDVRMLIEPSYLPEFYELVRTEARLCEDMEAMEALYQFPLSDNQYWIVRKTEPSWYSMYARDWFTETEIAGRAAILIQSPEGLLPDRRPTLLVREDFGVTVIQGPDPDELIGIAEGLNR